MRFIVFLGEKDNDFSKIQTPTKTLLDEMFIQSGKMLNLVSTLWGNSHNLHHKTHQQSRFTLFYTCFVNVRSTLSLNVTIWPNKKWEKPNFKRCWILFERPLDKAVTNAQHTPGLGSWNTKMVVILLEACLKEPGLSERSRVKRRRRKRKVAS